MAPLAPPTPTALQQPVHLYIKITNLIYKCPLEDIVVMAIFHFFIFEVLSFITKNVIQFKKSHVFTCNCSLNREMYGNATMRGCGTNAVCTVPCCFGAAKRG